MLYIPRPDSKQVDRRLKELHILLKEPHTLEQLALKTGRGKKAVYKDIAKLVALGCCIDRSGGVFTLQSELSHKVRLR